METLQVRIGELEEGDIIEKSIPGWEKRICKALRVNLPVLCMEQQGSQYSSVDQSKMIPKTMRSRWKGEWAECVGPCGLFEKTFASVCER